MSESAKTFKKVKPIKKRRIFAIAVTLAIGIVATFFVITVNIVAKSQKYIEEMADTIVAAETEYEKDVQLDEAYMSTMESTASSLAGYAAFYFYENGYSLFTREELTDIIGSSCWIYYYYGTAGSLDEVEKGYVQSDKDLKYELTDEETYDLLNDGTYQIDNVHYTSCQIDSTSYAIIRWGANQIFTENSILEAYSSARNQFVVRIDDETGIIEDSSETELVGEEAKDLIRINNSEWLLEDDDGEYTAKVGDIGSYGKCLYIEDKSLEGQTMICFLPLSDIRYDYLSGLIMPCLFLWAFIIIIMIYILKFIKEVVAADGGNTEFVHLFGKIYADGRLSSHTFGLTLFAVIITVLSVLYFQTILNYSSQNTSAKTNLETFNNFLDAASDNRSSFESDFLDLQLYKANAIAIYFMRYPDMLDDTTISTMISFLPEIREIEIFDDTGTVKFDTANNNGYTINRDENSSKNEYGIWNVIEGNSEVYGYYDSVTDSYVVAAGRQDARGAVVIKVAYNNLANAYALTEPDETLSTADFGIADRGLVLTEAPTVMYYAEAGDDTVKQVQNFLTDETSQNGFSGVKRGTDGERYFINTLANDKYIIISAVQTADMYGRLNKYTYLILVFAFVAQAALLLLTSLSRWNEPPENMMDLHNNPFLQETIEEQAMDKRFRSTLRNMLIVTSAIIGLQLLDNYIRSKSPIIKYLFSSSFSKGFNLFSITMIIIVVVAGMLCGAILQMLLIFFTKSMGPRGLTIGRMISSLLNFAILLAIVILSLMYLGIEPGTLLAGAGVMGALISFCAQQTVNDMLSGFFMVFENQFNIGDWITVDDFRGQVVEIGMRTTKLQKQSTYRVYNNNEIRKFTIAEYWDRGAQIDVDVAYKENIADVIAIINNNKERIVKEIPYIKDGPNILGVANLGESGITITIRAIADVEKVLTVEREMRRVLKEILDENGIEIPFKQVTLHTNEDITITTNKEEEK